MPTSNDETDYAGADPRIVAGVKALRAFNRDLRDYWGPEKYRQMRLQFLAKQSALYGDIGSIIAQNVTSCADEGEQ